MTRVLLHVGLHKTATTSVQGFLRDNLTRFWDHAAVILPHKIRPAKLHAMAYGLHGDPVDLVLMREELRAYVQGLKIGPRRDVVLSCEDLMGVMPENGPPYPRATEMIRAVIACFDHLPRGARFQVYISLRDPVRWLDSVWRHRLRKTQGAQMTLNRTEFANRVGPVDLRDRVARLAADLAPHRVVARDIDALAALPYGVAQPFVNFLPFSSDALAAMIPPVRRNAGHDPALSEALLALNRTPMDAGARAEAKRRLLGELHD